ncbi:hypothetical protein [Aestuariivirga sp.]|uniref:hypothetical protein n=1 Tax=Aestuariivirga sp. TaxID=2650926 RepID=UPI00391DFED8
MNSFAASQAGTPIESVTAPTAVPDPTLRDEPTREEVVEALQRINASRDFDATDRSRRLLDYLVTEALDGRGNRIKAYAIATEVLGRATSFDPQRDPIVRIEAARLRRVLEHYYLTEGRNDRVIIDIPKGAYTPRFALASSLSMTPPVQGEETAEASGAAQARNGGQAKGWQAHLAAASVIGALLLGLLAIAWTSTRQTTVSDAEMQIPGLLIRPFTDLTNTENSRLLTTGLTERIIEKTSRYKDIAVITGDGEPGYTSASHARYELGGTVRVQHDTMVLQTRLVDRSDGRVVWAESFDIQQQAVQLFHVEVEIANHIATIIAEPRGIVGEETRRESSEVPPDSWGAYSCILEAYAYRASLEPSQHATIRQCLERAVLQYPDYATAWALLSLAYADEFRFFYPPPEGNAVPALARAFEAARRAIDLDASNIRARQALMMTLFFQKDYREAIAVGEEALTLNPNDTEFKGDFGSRLALFGAWDRGCALVDDALSTGSRDVAYYEIILSLCRYIKNDFQSAADLVSHARADGNPAYHVIRSAILAEAGRTEEVAQSRKWLDRNVGNELPSLMTSMAERLVRVEDRKRFLSSLGKAGFDVPR